MIYLENGRKYEKTSICPKFFFFSVFGVVFGCLENELREENLIITDWVLFFDNILNNIIILLNINRFEKRHFQGTASIREGDTKKKSIFVQLRHLIKQPWCWKSVSINSKLERQKDADSNFESFWDVENIISSLLAKWILC